MQIFWRLARPFLLEIFLSISLLVLCLQLTWPGISLGMARPRPGQLGIIELPQHEQFMGISNRCLVYLPPHFDSTKPLPLILYLHGSGSRGNDIEKVRSCELLAYLYDGGDFPTIVVAPQCIHKQSWNVVALVNLIDLMIHQLGADADRVMVIGYSMGGYGTWNLASQIPEKLAAVVPLCGGGNTAVAEKMKSLSIWAFHGEQDNVVSLSANRAMVDAVIAAGGSARFTILKGRGHDIADVTYKNQELIVWLMQQKRDNSKPID